MGENFADRLIERDRPRPSSAPNQGRGQCEMAGSAEDERCRLDQLSGRPIQAVDTILTDPDDGQPAVY